MDERRVPDKGMKMRCPQCSESFTVLKSGDTQTAAPAPPLAPPPGLGGGGIPKGTMVGVAPPQLGGPPKAPAGSLAPAPAGAPPPPPPKAPGLPKGTLVGAAPPGFPPAAAPPPAAASKAAIGTFGSKPKGMAGTMVGAAPPIAPPFPGGDAPPPPPPAPAPQRPSRPAPIAPPFPEPGGDAMPPAPEPLKPSVRAPEAPERDAGGIDLDLPALKGPGEAGGFVVPTPGGPGMEELDLPVAKASHDVGGVDLPVAKGADSGIDLPVPKSSDDFGIDLPVPKSPDIGIDLPVPKSADSGIDLPVPKSADGGIDLPVPKSAGGGIDLPVPRSVDGGIDLPVPAADLPAPAADLPARPGAADFGQLDVPTSGATPAPPAPSRAATSMPPALGGGDDEASFGDLELPDLTAEASQPEESFADIELPPPVANAHMVPPQNATAIGYQPTPADGGDEASFGGLNDEGDSEMPPSLLADDVQETSFGDLNLDGPAPPPPPGPPGPPPPQIPAGLPEPMPPSVPTAIQGAPAFGADISTGPLPEPVSPTAPGTPTMGAMGGPASGGPEPYAPPDYGSPEGDAPGYGESDEFGETEFGDSEDEMEFGIDGEAGAEGEGEGTFSLPPDVLRRQRGEEFEAKQAAAGRRTTTVVGVVGVVAIVAMAVGGALGAFTHYGYFGQYLLEQYMPEAGTPDFTRQAIKRAEKMASADTFADIRGALKVLGEARGKASLSRGLLSRSVIHEGLYQLRFGDDQQSSGHIIAIMKRLEDRGGEAPEMELARAADAARRKKFGEALDLVEQARPKAGSDPYIDLFVGEIALSQGKPKVADKAFGKALKNGGGARAQWGIARAAATASDQKAFDQAVEETLKLSPNHVEARIEEARIVWEKGREGRATHLLAQALGQEPVDEQRLWTSKSAQAAGNSMMGYIHERRGRLTLARRSYEAALELDAFRVQALLGAGRVMLREKRSADALARFEAALNTAEKTKNPTVLSGRKADVEAQLGMGRALTRLDRGTEAKAKLEPLSTKNPQDYKILLAWGEAEKSLKKNDQAESLFRKAIDLAPATFDGYLSLAQLFFDLKEPAKASAALNDAASHVEETSQMRTMLGQSELQRNRLESAIHEFSRALELDPQDMEAKFGLGQSRRRNGDLVVAKRLFAELGRRDDAYAGLSMERGLLLEAEGDFEGAVRAYKAALENEKEKDDMQLVLRLGAAQVAANDLDAAEQTLQRVAREMPNSAETEYFIGRVQFARGRTPDALTRFDRALSLDGTQAEFHLYAARAALEMKNLGRTREEVEAAIKRDPNLGDAYWVRGEVKLRIGAVKDALRDLKNALKLNPARAEAFATMGDCYDQMRELGKAISAYNDALKAQPHNGGWWYRLARITVDKGQRGDGYTHIKRALQEGANLDPRPLWLADAYMMAGELAGDRGERKAAIQFYKTYMEVAPPGHQDQKTVKRRLREFGVEIRKEEF